MADIRLKIELLYTDPLVWRRVVVPEKINLLRLHEVIQAVMGWEEVHLFEFECNGRYYGLPDEWSDRPIALARNAQLKAIAARAEENTFYYRYDFGDDWLHRITIEATDLAETSPCPRLVEAERACPPEDIGGTLGYEALLEAAAGQPNEHGKMLLEMLGGEFNPDDVDTDEVAAMLEPIQRGFKRNKVKRKPLPASDQGAWPIDMTRSLKD
ncbi:plasmid pRiA4b ORF-3 family protein [Halomonas sp. TBZ9]|uniref:Plasmid pRiA4b ORF-3 family protein n=1 Tax=Vreelandella azerica TaxID=2732867 RepID=A0A7Y3X9T0_9GAMM|nr:plasmid pRiA4b ORF-3 family protein [Halomonas azerica]NOG30553.1 plasmid pRiA4b ORF-3 family protein [Halomonas azerica]